MVKKDKKGFTLIELIAVLVIMSIIALIVTPLVMSIIRKARISADKRSVDAYGRSIELSIAGYLMDTGDFPTELSQLTVEYTGDEVVCATSHINNDATLYLTDCTVAGRSVDYVYGKYKDGIEKAYNTGDVVEYNNEKYFVMKDSSKSETTVTLLKAYPLTIDEINLYGGVGTENNHVNMHVLQDEDFYQTAANDNGYGGMAYYSSETCRYDENYYEIYSGCTIDYAQSEVKYVVDAWARLKAPQASEARLITYEEASDLLQNPDYLVWVDNCSFSYWTMGHQYDESYNLHSAVIDSQNNVLGIVHEPSQVRPVITVTKSFNLKKTEIDWEECHSTVEQ